MYLTTLLREWTSNSAHRNTELGDLPSSVYKQSIPKVLFQICLRQKAETAEDVLQTLPAEIIANISNLKVANPSWEYRLICDKEAEAIIKSEYGKTMWDCFNRINPAYGAARADLLRYLLLYRFGGVYLDIKSGLSKRLDDSIGEDDGFIAFYWDNIEGGGRHFAIKEDMKYGELFQGFIVSVAGHPLMKAVLEETIKRMDSYNPYVNGIGFGGVVTTTGPGMYSDVIYRNINQGISDFRIGKPFAEFGYIKNVVSEGQTYLKKSKLSDYRICSEPLIWSDNFLLNIVNKVYLKMLSCFRLHNLYK